MGVVYLSDHLPTLTAFTAPVVEYPFPTVLEPMRVPPGYFPIEVVQFWRGEIVPGRPLPLHWAIIVRTDADRGNCHEIVGDKHTYATQDRFDIPVNWERHKDWRGAHVVGYVSPDRLNDFLNHIALVPVVRERWTWNCQNWVYDALTGLNQPDLYTDVNMTFGALQTQMCCLLEAWEIGEI